MSTGHGLFASAYPLSVAVLSVTRCIAAVIRVTKSRLRFHTVRRPYHLAPCAGDFTSVVNQIRPGAFIEAMKTNSLIAKGYRNMNTRFTTILGSTVLALVVAMTGGVAEAGKGGGAGRQGGSPGHAGGSTYGPGPAISQGFETRNSNQYQYRHQYQHRNQNNVWNANSKSASADTRKERYSDDRYLNQKDFQAWLNQEQPKNQHQNRVQDQYQAQTKVQDSP